jgi:hypothetical protein
MLRWIPYDPDKDERPFDKAEQPGKKKGGKN